MADMSGMAELRARLATLPPGIVNNILRGAVRQGVNVITAAAKANFPGADNGPESLTGVLKGSIRTSSGRGSPTLAVAYTVAGTLTPAQINKFGADSAYYAMWVERGHINRKMNDALSGSKQFKTYQRAISGSNTPPHPFMRPAFENNSAAALDAIIETVRSKLPGLVK